MSSRRISIALACSIMFMGTGCTMQPKVEYRDVMVPTPALPELPQELLTPQVVALPVFVAAGHPDAVAGLTAGQSLVFKQWLASLKAQIVGFRALFDVEPPQQIRPP